MLFARFYLKNVFPLDDAPFMPGDGDRAVVLYPSKRRLADVTNDAAYLCRSRGFVAFALCRGDTFKTAKVITKIIEVA